MNQLQPTQAQMEALAQWWTAAIFGTSIRSNGDTSKNGVTSMVLQTMLAVDNLKVSDESAFRDALLKGILTVPHEELCVDYHPRGAALIEAARVAKLSDFALPPKIYSYWNFRENVYKGANGYAADIEVIA